MSDVSCLSVRHFNGTWKRQWPCCRRWVRAYTGNSSPNHVEKCWRIWPDDGICRFDNVPQDGVSTGTAKAANYRHRIAPNARSHHWLTAPSSVFATNYLATEEVDPGWPSTSGSSLFNNSHGSEWESVVAPTNEKWRKGVINKYSNT